MTSKINELADKIYHEGVEKAELEAKNILSNAKEKAAQIVAEAEQKAQQTIQDATKKTKLMYAGIQEELQLAANQAVVLTKQKIMDCILTDASKKATNELLDDPKFVHAFFMSLAKNWGHETTSADELVVHLSKEQMSALQSYFKSKVFESLKAQPQINISSESRKGFQITSHKSGFKLSFTEHDFEAYFRSFLKPKIQEYLFEKSVNE